MLSIEQKSKPARTIPFLLTLLVALATAIAAPAAGQAEPAEGPQPQLAFEPGSYDFGLQPVNSGPGQANLQLRNVGTEAVQVNSVEISGPGSEAFWTGTNCLGLTLQPNETCFVQAYFSPHDATEYAVQLRANAGPYSFVADLSGTGGRAEFAPDSNPTDFGSAAVGSAGTTREIVVSNVGNAPGGAFIAVISGGAVGSFQLLDENCTGHLLMPAATCTLQVRFRPLSEGVKTAYLSLFGEQDGGTQIVLTGVGTVAATEDASPPPAGAAAASTPGPAARTPARRHRRKSRFHGRSRRPAIAAGRVLTRAG